MARFLDTFFTIEGETGIDFCGDAPWDAFEYFRTKIDRQFIAGIGDLRLAVAALFCSPGEGIIDKPGVVIQSGSL